MQVVFLKSSSCEILQEILRAFFLGIYNCYNIYFFLKRMYSEMRVNIYFGCWVKWASKLVEMNETCTCRFVY
jgi:hypothetical protein